MKFRTSRQFLSRLASRRAARLLGTATLLTLGTVSLAHADNYYWDPGQTGTGLGSGGAGTWNAQPYWHLLGGGDFIWPNTTANTADFAGTAGYVSLAGNITAGGLIFDTTGYTVGMGSNFLSIDANGITQNVATAAISGTNTLTLTASQTWTVASGGLLTVSAPVTNNNTLTFAGAGSQTVSSVISGTGALVMNGTGTLTLSGTNTFTGGVTLNSGAVALSNAGTNLGAAPASPTVQVTFGGSSTLQIGNNNLVANRLIQINSGVTGTIDTGANTGSGVIGVISGAGNLAKVGTGTLALAGANTYSGTTTVGTVGSLTSGGTLTVSGSAGSIATSSGITINGAGSQLLLDNASLTATPDRIGNSVPVMLNLGGEFRFNNSSTASTSLTEVVGQLNLGTGTGIVSNSNGSSGTSTSLLTFSGFSRGSNFATGLVRGTNLGFANNGSYSKISLTSTSGLTQIGTTTATNGTSTGTTKNLTIVPYLIGATSLTSVGTDFVTYDTTSGFRRLGDGETSLLTGTPSTGDNVNAASGTNTISGSPTYNSLLLNAGGTSATPGTTAQTVTGTGTLTLSSGAMVNVATGSSGSATLSGFASIVFGNGSSNTATTINEAIIGNVNTSATLTIASPINTFAAGGGLTTYGGGTTILTASNLYTGQTTINQGTLQIGAAGTTGDLGTNTAAVLDNGTLAFNRTNAYTFANSISGAGAVTQAGTGTLTLSGTNTYSGVTNFNTLGGVVLGAAAALSPNSTLTFNAATNLNLGGFSASGGGLSFGTSTSAFTATVTNGSLTLGNNNVNLTGYNTTSGSTDLLNLSALTSFTYTQAAAGQVFAISVGGTSAVTSNATLTLSSTANAITVTTLNVGTGGNAVGGIGTLNLGTTNTINTNTIQLGGYRSLGGTVQFASGLTSPTLTLRGVASGTAAVSSLNVGYDQSGGQNQTGLFDTTAGTINAIVNSTYVSQVGTATPGTALAGTFQMTLGTYNAGTIFLGYTNQSSVTATTNTATFTQNAGAVLADVVSFAVDAAATPGTTLKTVSIYNLGTSSTTGILSAGLINLGTAAATTSTETLNFNNGTITNYDNTANGFSGQGNANGTSINVGNLTIAGLTGGGAASSNLTLNIVLASTGTHNLLAESGYTITENSTALLSGTGALTINGAGNVILLGTNTYSGATTINSGSTLQLGNGGTVGSIASSAVTDNGTFVINRSNATPQASSFGTISGTGAVNLIGTGTTTFTSANTYTGATTINLGTLTLGAGGSIGTASSTTATSGGALVMGSGTLNLTRTDSASQTFSGTTFNSGGSTINVTAGDTLNLGAITRNTGGTVYFGYTGTITTSTANGNGTTSNTGSNGFLGAYGVYGSSSGGSGAGAYDWAANSGGTITAFNGYTTYDNVASFSSGASGADLTDNYNNGHDGYDGTYTNSATVNSVRFNTGSTSGDSNTNPIININGGNTLTISSGGILVTPNLGVKYAIINGGGLTTGSSQDLVIQQWNTGSGHLQIGSSIYGSGGLTKAGPGQLDLNGFNATYTGATTVNGGILDVATAITATSNVTVNNSGTLLLGGNNNINNAATVTLNGGTINTAGYSQGTATSSAAATQGLGALTLSSSSTLDFGSGHTGSSVLAFANSSAQTWTGTLTLTDFTPGTDFLNFASNTGLTSMQLSEISLSNYAVIGIDSFGNVVFTAVPEPATWAGGMLLVVVAGWQFRRRNVRCAA